MKSLLFAALLVIGCGKSEQAAPPPPTDPGSGSVATGSGSGSAAPDPGTGSGSAVVPAEAPVDVATEMDYEDLATSEITEATVETRVKELEASLAPE